jgi:RNA polymerase sigma-70 factor (ECF subfamily)
MSVGQGDRMDERTDLKEFFGRCVEENTDSLYGLAFRLTRNAADAEDVVAEAVAKAWAAFHTLEDQSRFRPWMFRILHNCFISDYRKKSARPVEISYQDASFEDADHGCHEVASMLIEQPDDFLLWWANPEREFANSMLGKDIMAAIEVLPEVFRTTVLLINVENLSYDEAAEVLGVSPGTIRSRMNRGRTLLQKALWQHAKDAGLIAKDTSTERAT